MEGKGEKAVSYIEWLRQSRGQPTFRSMLEADLRETIQDANDIGHFFLIMEHKGYEIKHGARLGFRLRGQERFMVPGRKNPLFTEDASAPPSMGTWTRLPLAIVRRLSTGPGMSRTAGASPRSIPDLWPCTSTTSICWARPAAAVSAEDDAPSQTGDHEVRELQGAVRLPAGAWYYYGGGFECRPRPRRGNAGQPDETAHHLNVRKKKRRALYDASPTRRLAPARDCYESGMPGMEEQFAKYMDAVSTLEQCGIPREQLMAEKAELYRQLADVNREIRQARKEIAMCETIEKNRPQMEHDIQVAERRGRQQEMELPSR